MKKKFSFFYLIFFRYFPIFLIALTLFSIGINSAEADQGVLGNNDPEGTFGYINTDSIGPNIMNAYAFTMPSQEGSPNSILFYVNSIYTFVPGLPDVPSPYQMAIYSDNNGAPDSLIASTLPGYLTANSWNQLQISGSLSPNTTYWLVYNTFGGVRAPSISTANNKQNCYKASTYGSFPTQFGTCDGYTPKKEKIYVIYDIPTYTISAYTDTAGGTISPSGDNTVNSGGVLAFTVTPTSGYFITNLLVDGLPQNIGDGSAATYTFSNVFTDHVIEASFSTTSASFVITATAGSGGSISPSGKFTAARNSSVPFTITANSGNKTCSVNVDGVPVPPPYTPYTISGIIANHKIDAIFGPSLATYNINITVGANGSISPSPTSGNNYYVSSCASPIFTITPNTGYYVADVLVDGTSVGSIDSYTFPNVNANHTLSVSFAPDVSYVVSASTNTGGGTIDPLGDVSVSSQSTQTFTMKPDSGYRVLSVLVDGSSTSTATSTYFFSNLTGNHSISASFNDPNAYTVGYATKGTYVNTGDSSYMNAYKFTTPAQAGSLVSMSVYEDSPLSDSPNNKYQVAIYSDAGGVPGSLLTMSTIAVLSQAGWNTIPVTGALAGSTNYWLVYSTNGTQAWANNMRFDNGSSGQKCYKPGTFGTFPATFGTCQGTAAYQGSIYATYSTASSVIISASAGTGGTISPSGSVPVISGSTPTFIITPNNGYQISDVKVDGTSVGAVSSYTFSSVTADHNITVTFSALPSYTINASAGSGGNIYPSGSITVYGGRSQTFTITPNAGQEINSLLVDGTSVGAVSSYTFSNVAAGHTISASFSGESTATLGYTSVTGYKRIGANSNYINAFKVNTGNQAGSLISMSAYVNSPIGASPNNKYQMAIYSDNNGIPGALFATTQIGTLTGNSWNTLSISGSLTPNTTYWLAYNTNGADISSNLLTFAAGAPGNSAQMSQTFGTYPSTFGTLLPNGSSWIAGIYATYYAGTTYPITVTAGFGGIISPSGSVSVGLGASKTFTITPLGGYIINTVYVDGTSVGAVSSYTFSNVHSSHTISANFSLSNTSGNPTPSLIGYAWAATIGFIDMSGVNVNTADNTLTGYGWSPSVGFIKFGGFNVSDLPSGPGTSQVNAVISGNKLVGWARACGGTIKSSDPYLSYLDYPVHLPTLPGNCSTMTSRPDGWDGWISLNGFNGSQEYTRYGPSVGSDGSISGYIWGGNVVGWINLALGISSTCSVPNIYGPIQGYVAVPQTFSIVSSIPTGTIRYGFDWSNTHVATEWVPTTATAASGVTQNINHSWNAVGTTTFNGRCEDNSSRVSDWRPYTITINPEPGAVINWQQASCDTRNISVTWTLDSQFQSLVSSYEIILYDLQNNEIYDRTGIAKTTFGWNIPGSGYDPSHPTVYYNLSTYDPNAIFKVRLVTHYTSPIPTPDPSEVTVPDGPCQTNNLNLNCYFVPENSPPPPGPLVNNPVTYTLDILGGTQPYSIVWTDSDGLNYSQSNVAGTCDNATCNGSVNLTRVYTTVGQKTIQAVVTDSSSPILTYICSLNTTTTRKGPYVRVVPTFQEF